MHVLLMLRGAADSAPRLPVHSVDDDVRVLCDALGVDRGVRRWVVLPGKHDEHSGMIMRIVGKHYCHYDQHYMHHYTHHYKRHGL